MEEALAPDTTIASVAAGMALPEPGLLGGLRKPWGRKLPGISVSPAACTAFVPVKVEEETAASAPLPAPRTPPVARRRIGAVEITLGNGRTIKVDEEIDPALLARLAAALDGGRR